MRKFYDFMRFYKSKKPVGVVEAAGSNPVTQTSRRRFVRISFLFYTAGLFGGFVLGGIALKVVRIFIGKVGVKEV